MSTDYSGLGGQHVGHGKELAGIGDDGGRLEHLPVRGQCAHESQKAWQVPQKCLKTGSFGTFNREREETALGKNWEMLEFSEILTGLSHQGGEALGSQPGKALEIPSSTRLEARFPYHGSGAMTRSPSPLAWRPDFPGAPREAH